MAVNTHYKQQLSQWKGSSDKAIDVSALHLSITNSNKYSFFVLIRIEILEISDKMSVQ